MNRTIGGMPKEKWMKMYGKDMRACGVDEDTKGCRGKIRLAESRCVEYRRKRSSID